MVTDQLSIPVLELKPLPPPALVSRQKPNVIGAPVAEKSGAPTPSTSEKSS
jgi:hypothetical protein